MAPLTTGIVPVPSTAYHDTILVMKEPDSPWDMDLNTSVTIVLGVLGLILQAWQICYRPRHVMPTTRDGPPHGLESTAEAPNSPVPYSQHGQTRQSTGRGGSARSFHPPPRPSLREPPYRPAGQDRNPDRYEWRASSGDFRRRSSHFAGSGPRGGGTSLSGRGRHRSQYSNGWSTPNLGSAYEN